MEDGEKAIIKDLVRNEIKDCPVGKGLLSDIQDIDRRVTQMQYEFKQDIMRIYDKVEENGKAITSKVDNTIKETNSRWFSLLVAILGQFLGVVTGMLLLAMKISKGVG